MNDDSSYNKLNKTYTRLTKLRLPEKQKDELHKKLQELYERTKTK